MTTESLLLTVLFCLTLTAFIGAVNARGLVRVALSYFFAILCLCAAVFHTTRHFAAEGGSPAARRAAAAKAGASDSSPAEVKELAVDDPAGAAPVERPLGAATEEDPTAPDAGSGEAVSGNAGPGDAAKASRQIADSEEDVATGEYRQQLRTLTGRAQKQAQVLAALDLGRATEASDEEYEALKRRSAKNLADIRVLRAELTALGASPSATRQGRQALLSGLDALIAACGHYDRFFKAENGSEERIRREAFEKGVRQAQDSFRRALTLLR